jgi:cytochrome c biogenesis protein CcdA
MVGTIIPMVHGERSKRRGHLILLAHIAGYVLGGLATGAVFGLIGAVLSHAIAPRLHGLTILAMSSLLSMLCSAGELGLAPFKWPQASWAVPADWRLLRPRSMVAMLYGFLLGTGWTTRIPVSTFYVVAVWSLLGGNPGLGALAMATFGLGRAVPILWLFRRIATGDAACLKEQSLLGLWQPVVPYINGLALAFGGSCLWVSWMKSP